MYDTSARNSPVKYADLSGESVVRGLPFSQVKSANAKGSGFFAVVSAKQGDCAPLDAPNVRLTARATPATRDVVRGRDGRIDMHSRYASPREGRAMPAATDVKKS